MIDVKSAGSNEVNKTSQTENKSFDPDKRIDVKPNQDSKENSGYDVDKRVEAKKSELPMNETQCEGTSYYDVKEKNEPIKNKQDGLEREKKVEEELKNKYPESKGYEVLSEVYLRDKNGMIVKDPITGEARRVDFVVVNNGKVVDSIEVTSKTADKTGQSAKEERIRDNGGNYFRDKNGSLVEIPSDVHTRIERRD